MDSINFFNAEKYFSDMCAKNKLARKHGFHFCTCSGIENLEGPLQEFSTQSAFFCLDDTNDGGYGTGRSGGWHKKRVFTVFFLHRYEYNNEDKRLSALQLCRDLSRQALSKMIKDTEDLENELVYLDVNNVMTRELGKYFLNGCTGCYFMIEMGEPVNLVYNPDEWLE